jgi:ribosomal-protein-alanine N-acetyltransferase
MSAVARQPGFDVNGVELIPMKRRHLRQVLRIEGQVYPRPWSSALFLQEIAHRYDRVYLVARLGGQVLGYGGLMTSGLEGHITNVAVDPAYQGSSLGTRLMLGLMEAAIDRGGKTVSLEVRKSNEVAQRLYEKFGFQPVGVRRGYYVETGEDALVMWVEGVDTEEYEEKLELIREELDG